MELRPYQQEAVDAVFREWESVQSTLLVLPTGTGKTICFSAITKRIADAGGKVLILAHRGELLEQAKDKLKTGVALESELEKADAYASLDARVVVGSVQTMYREERLSRYATDHFDAVIVDEAHHAVTDTYRRIFDHFSGAKLLGVTATPKRSDLRSVSEIFASVAYKYDIRSAIDAGWLSRIAIQRCNLEIDISDVSCVAGDYQSSELGEALTPYLEQIADQIALKAAGRKILVFVPLVSIGEEFAALLNRKGFRAACVSAKSKDRQELTDVFSSGQLDAVCNAMLFSEGYDNPAVDCIVNLRATRSDSLYRQIMGRGLRLSPGKENCLVLDFLWHTSRKGYDILSPVDLFLDKADIPYANDLLAGESVMELDSLESLASNARINAAAALAKQLRDAQTRHFGNRTFTELHRDNLLYLYDADTDNLDTVCISGDPALEFYFGKGRWEWSPTSYWQIDPVTEKQREMLSGIGVDVKNLQFRGQASDVISAYMKRKEAGFCSFKQARFLAHKGFKHTCMWSASSASGIMNDISRNHWRIPRSIRPSKYKPSDFFTYAALYRKNRFPGMEVTL